MRLRIAGTLALAAAVGMGWAPPAGAQLEENLGALSGDNAKGYLGPLPKALSGTLNTSIFQTGFVPRSGFTMTVGARLMGMTFDDEDRTYSPKDPPGFTSTESVRAPTIIGPTQAVLQNGQSGTVLYHPSGFDIEEFAAATTQVTIGSVLGTRAVVRWLSVNFTDDDIGKFTLFGIGAQHSISQYFSNLPVDLAAGAFYQTFDVGDDLVQSKALQLNVTASKAYNWLQPYVGVGYDQLDMEAHYASSTGGGTIDVDFDTETSAHFTVGAQAKLAVVHLYGEANLAATNGFAVGLSFGNGF